jgi:hypothetical protein
VPALREFAPPCCHIAVGWPFGIPIDLWGSNKGRFQVEKLSKLDGGRCSGRDQLRREMRLSGMQARRRRRERNFPGSRGQECSEVTTAQD